MLGCKTHLKTRLLAPLCKSVDVIMCAWLASLAGMVTKGMVLASMAGMVTKGVVLASMTGVVTKGMVLASMAGMVTKGMVLASMTGMPRRFPSSA